MERLPRRTPQGDVNLLGMVFDALATAVEDIPIIGDIVAFIASLFGNSSASNARIARLETIVSKGSSGFDDFNRADTSVLGRGPTMTADWVQGGDGQPLGVRGRAAGLVEAVLPDDGRRWARYPVPASSSTMTADTIVDDKKVDNRACTSVMVAANAAFTEFVYANVFGTGVYLGRGTRSGNDWTFTDWKQNPSYKVGTAERVEVRASGSGIYQLVVDNTVILEHTDVSYPIDAEHRYVGFAVQCWTAVAAVPAYGWRLSAFSLKSEAGTFTAIESVETIANGAVTVANGAQTTANGAAQDVVNVKKEVIQKIVAFDIKSPTPGYVAINGTEWPSIPHSDLEMMPADVYIAAHSHGENNETGILAKTDDTTIGSVAVRMTRFPEKMMSAGQQWFSFIRIPVDTPLSGLNFYARGTPSDLRTRVYSMSPTGDMTAVTLESDNLAGLLVAGKHTSTPTNFSNALIEAGTWVAVRFRVVGTVWLAGKEKFAPERPAGFYPRQLNATTALASGTASPASIAESSVTWPVDQGFVPYVAVGNNILVTPVKRSLSDNFDRADTSDARQGIGSNWSLQQTTMGLINLSSGIRIVQNAIVWRGSGDGSAEYTYATPLTTDKAYGRVHIGEPATTAWTRALARVGGSSGVAIGFRAGTITLDKRTGFNAYTTSVTVSQTLVSGDAITYQVGTDTNPDEIFVWHNGVEVIHTSSVVVPSGPGKRYCGVFMERTPNNNSTAILDWEAFDISDVESTP